MRWNGVKDGLKSIAFVSTKEEAMIWQHRTYKKWDTPDIALLVVDTDGENRLVARNDLAGTMKGVVFRAFYVHLDHSDRFDDRKFIEGITPNIDACTIAVFRI